MATVTRARRLADGLAHLGRLDAVVDGVAHDVQERPLELLEHVAIELHVAAVDDEARLLARLLARVAQRAAEWLAQVARGHHAHGAQRLVGGDDVRLQRLGVVDERAPHAAQPREQGEERARLDAMPVAGRAPQLVDGVHGAGGAFSLALQAAAQPAQIVEAALERGQPRHGDAHALRRRIDGRLGLANRLTG